jgi:hypothetical protein
MTSDPGQGQTDDEHEDQDAEPGSVPTGAAAADPPEGDQDAGPASEPDPS